MKGVPESPATSGSLPLLNEKAQQQLFQLSCNRKFPAGTACVGGTSQCHHHHRMALLFAIFSVSLLFRALQRRSLQRLAMYRVLPLLREALKTFSFQSASDYHYYYCYLFFLFFLFFFFFSLSLSFLLCRPLRFFSLTLRTFTQMLLLSR